MYQVSSKAERDKDDNLKLNRMVQAKYTQFFLNSSVQLQVEYTHTAIKQDITSYADRGYTMACP